MVGEENLVFFRALDPHVVLPARVFGVEVEVEFFVAVDGEFDVIA